MAELHSNLYFKHANPDIMTNLKSLFYDYSGDQEKLINIATAINQKKGKELVENIIDSVMEPEHDLSAETISRRNGYMSLHFVHGTMGDENMEKIVCFLYKLVPDIHAQAWGEGDDDPWEFWIKFENGKIARRDDEPLMDEEEDAEIKRTIYEWWHKDMPNDIKEGVLNDENDENYLEGKHIVFTGKMSQGNREEMENMAEEHGARIQKSINKKTEILVMGERAGATKVNKAEELGVEILTEAEFYDIVDVEDDYNDFDDLPPLSHVEGFESLSNFKLEKVSQLLNQMTRDSLVDIPYAKFYELVINDVSAKHKFDGSNLAYIDSNGGWVQMNFYFEPARGEVDLDIIEMASALLKLGIITEERLDQMNLKNMTFDLPFNWSGEHFHAEFRICIDDKRIYMVKLEVRVM